MIFQQDYLLIRVQANATLQPIKFTEKDQHKVCLDSIIADHNILNGIISSVILFDNDFLIEAVKIIISCCAG